jgi:hypothetical protein
VRVVIDLNGITAMELLLIFHRAIHGNGIGFAIEKIEMKNMTQCEEQGARLLQGRLKKSAYYKYQDYICLEGK